MLVGMQQGPLLVRRRSEGFSYVAAPATLSPNYRGGLTTLSNGNRTATKDATFAYSNVMSVDAVTSGKHYFDVTIAVFGADTAIGIGNYAVPLDTGVAQSGGSTKENVVVDMGGNLTVNSTSPMYNNVIATLVAGDVVGVAYDADARTIAFRKNLGAWSANYNVPGSQPMAPLAQMRNANAALAFNFGQAAFLGAPPIGFAGGWSKRENYAGRYWRYHGIATSDGGGSNIAEIAMRLVSGGANQIGAGVPGALNDAGASYIASKAVDGSNATFWANGALGAAPHAYWFYDFGSARAIKEIVMKLRSDYHQYPTSLAFTSSDDNVNFFPARRWHGTWTIGEQKTFAVADG